MAAPDASRSRRLAASLGAELIRLDGGGPAAARNAGVRAATGDVVLFVDDDCVPSAGWASELAATVARGSRLVVAGSVSRARGRRRVAAGERTAGRGCGSGVGAAPDQQPGLPAQPPARGSLRRAVPNGGRRGSGLVRPRRPRRRDARARSRRLRRAPRATCGRAAFFAQQFRYGRAVRQLQRHGTHAPVPRSALLRAFAHGAHDGAARRRSDGGARRRRPRSDTSSRWLSNHPGRV